MAACESEAQGNGGHAEFFAAFRYCGMALRQ